VTFADLTDSRVTRGSVQSWQHDFDLSVEAHKAWPHLSQPEHRALICAADSGLPLLVTWRSNRSTYTHTSVDQTTDTCLVESYHIRPGVTDNLRVRRWGFAHPLHLGDIVSVDTPDATYDFDVE